MKYRSLDLIVPEQPVKTEDMSGDEPVKDEFQCRVNSEEPQVFTKIVLNDLIRDLGLTKEKAELFGSRLKEKNLLVAEFAQFFKQEQDLV